MIPEHIPVMVSEVLEYLQPQPGQVIIDGTVGLGGHAKNICSRLGSSGQLIGFDRDAETLRCCHANLQAFDGVTLVHNSYDSIPEELRQRNLSSIDGVLLDLGLSSYQLDQRNRGFSFQEEGRLDMRFDTSRGQSAADILRTTDEHTLRNWLFTFGEERHSGKIARQIKRAPSMETVQDLKEAIRKSTPPAFRQKSFARVFQALRIVVNQELEHLDRFLIDCISFVKPTGRVVIISYHSLEDRRVKHTFREYRQQGLVNVLTRKPQVASQDEIQGNPRARSAKLRAAEVTA
ncbi:MAG: 16S rRNA (cytosine(1402)-N(4))-methyltransferase RsmH [FCB group bacterium]|nr:16S rRNA (cytosine(1402)-N(4))-methyltransferase RsmH [FCB group bacterium]